MRDEVRYHEEQRAEIDRLRAAYPWLPALGCHAGWVGLIRILCGELESVLGRQALRGEGGKPVHVACTEKFGRLRVSLFGVPEPERDAVEAFVRAADAASATVCEVCGASGNTRDHGGLGTTRCGRHHAQLQAERARRT